MKHPFSIIDLTHVLKTSNPTWNGSCGFEQTIVKDYTGSDADVKFRVQKINMHAGIGTHIDAPAHCIPKGKTIDQLSLEDLCVPCCMVDISKKAHESYSLTIDDIFAFEDNHGKISPETCIIVHTGWDRFWDYSDKYRNDYKYPSISKEAAELLLERNVAGIGIDTLSPDRPESGFIVHHLFLGAGKYIIENIAHANKLPPKGAYSLALPLNNEAGTEAPLRLVGMILPS